MKLKLIAALVDESKTEAVLDAARGAGATGVTILTNARGEGRKPPKTFFGMDLDARRDVLLFAVAEAQARNILDGIREAGNFDTELGAGIAFQLAIEDTCGMDAQLAKMREELEKA